MELFLESIKESYQECLEEKHITIEKKDGILYLTLNRPQISNGFTNGMYQLLSETLEQVNNDDTIRAIVFKGEGKNFCSGNDLSNFGSLNEIEDIKVIQDITKIMGNTVLFRLQSAFMNLKKVSIACVQGAAIGVGFSILPLLDYVFITETTFFEFPLLQLAQGPEMLSTVTFPRIFGRQLAHDIIFSGRRIPAKEIIQTSLVQKMLKTKEEMYAHAEKVVEHIKTIDYTALIRAKELLHKQEQTIMEQQCKAECENLGYLWGRKDAILQAVFKRLQKPKL